MNLNVYTHKHRNTYWRTETSDSKVRGPAFYAHTLQHTATHTPYNTLQHTATPCNAHRDERQQGAQSSIRPSSWEGIYIHVYVYTHTHRSTYWCTETSERKVRSPAFQHLPETSMRCTEERQRCTTFWHPTKIDILKSQLATQCSIQNDYRVIFREIVPCGALRKDKGELPSDS